MKLSIIVPVYKVEEYIHECIDSILDQRFTDYELILVDDGSPDRCGAICDEYANKDQRIRVIHRENGGLSAARNSGIEVAEGEYIAFVDSDDHIGKDFFKRAMLLTENEGIQADIVEMPVEVYYNAPSHYTYRVNPGKDRTFTYPQSWINWVETEGVTHTYAWNKVYKKKLFNKIRFPEGRCFEDVYTIPRLTKKARVITFCGATSKDERYYYRLRNNSITTAASRHTLNDALRHHCLLMNELTYTPHHISPQSICRYFMQVSNALIDLLRILDKASFQDEEQMKLIKKVYKHLLRLSPQKRTLIQSSVGTRQKIKSLTLALCGIKTHCFLYSGKWIPDIEMNKKNILQ